MGNREKLSPIELSHVDIVNDGNLILSDVSLEVDRGEFVYLVGKVGSGKTSIIKSIIGEIPIETGEARAVGYNLRKLKQRQIPYLRRSIGVVFQDFQLLMDRTIEENLDFVLSATGWSDSRAKNRKITEVLEGVGMLSKAHKMPHQLSGGEQQRVAIARALLNNPEVILADEPTGSLDSETAGEIMNLLMEIHREHGPAIIMVTHNRFMFQRYPGRVFVCENQECKELNTTEEIDLSDLFEKQ